MLLRGTLSAEWHSPLLGEIPPHPAQHHSAQDHSPSHLHVLRDPKPVPYKVHLKFNLEAIALTWHRVTLHHHTAISPAATAFAATTAFTTRNPVHHLNHYHRRQVRPHDLPPRDSRCWANGRRAGRRLQSPFDFRRCGRALPPLFCCNAPCRSPHQHLPTDMCLLVVFLTYRIGCRCISPDNLPSCTKPCSSTRQRHRLHLIAFAGCRDAGSCWFTASCDASHGGEAPSAS